MKKLFFIAAALPVAGFLLGASEPRSAEETAVHAPANRKTPSAPADEEGPPGSTLKGEEKYPAELQDLFQSL